MKRLLSVVLAVAMLATMLSVPAVVGAKSYPTIDLSSDFVADTSLANSGLTETAVYGIAGKDASDESAMLKENSNVWTSWYTYNHGEELYFENGEPMEGYLVAELNFMAPDSAYLKEFIFGISTNQHRMTVDPTAKIIENIGKWNHLRMVYWADKTNCDFKDFSDDVPNEAAKLGSTILYLNGVELGQRDLTCAADTYSAPINTLLLEVSSGDKSAQHFTYYDDIKIYKSATNPGAQANEGIAATDEYTVSGTTITLANGAQLTPADIAAANSGYTITAFADANLALENAVVAKSPDGVYTYYSVADATTRIIYTSNNGQIDSSWLAKFSQISASGVDGMDLTDQASKLTANAGHNGNALINNGTAYTKSADKNYFVIEANINPVDGEVDMTNLTINTNSHNVVCGAVTFPFNQWNKYLMYVDYSTGKSQAFVNGTQVITDYACTSGFGDTKNTVRLSFNSAAGDQFEVYVDDLRIYETSTLPDGVLKTSKPVLASNTYYSVSEGKVKALHTTTVADIKAANTALTTRVYTDATMTEYAADTAAVQTGMVVAVENGYKTISTYPVVVFYGENEIYLATGDDSAPFPSVINATGDVVTTGYAGKEGSLLKITQAGGDTWFGKTWGEYTDSVWNKADYKGYLIVEMSIFNVDCTEVSLCTDGGSEVCGNIIDYIPENQWSRVKFVVDATTAVAGGKAYAYVDGVKTAVETSHKLGQVHSGTALKDDIRFRVKGGSCPSYVDDIRIYEASGLRPEQAIGFTAPGVCRATQNEFAYVAGVPVTLGDINAANPDTTLKVYDNTTSYTEITDTAATLAAGNVIFISKQSQSAIDAGFDYKDLFRIMTVEEAPATKDIVTSVPQSSVRVTTADVAGGIYGNTSATIKAATDGNTADSNWYFAHSYKGISTGMNYIVYETDFAPTSDTQFVFVGANGNDHLSASIKAGTELTVNQWHKIVMVYDVANDLSDVYVNGKLVSEDYKGCYSSKMAAYTTLFELRFIVQCKAGSVSYVDNYRVYESVIYPTIEAPVALADGYNQTVTGFVDNVAAKVNVKSGATADITIPGAEVSVFNSNYEAVDSADTLATGDIIVIKKDGNFAYYTANVLADNDIVVLGDTYDANTGVMTPGTISAYGLTSDGGVVVAAQYGEDGSIVKMSMSDDANDGIISLEFEAEDIDDTKLKVFLMASKASIRPLCKTTEINVTRSYNLLMLGNSFSMDVTCYMEEIAAAAGKQFNIHVLNKGGSAVSYHYNNREMPLSSSDINFFKNDVHVGKSNLKTTLETYDYDYVVIQYWGGSTSFYENTDANYAANWAVITDLAAYIHEREPNAELMLHETWSFEAGYNSFTDAATRDEAGANIRAIYDRCAAEMKAELGLDYDVRKISSLDAFEAARKYVNADGVQMFETTYYKDGHRFPDYIVRTTIPVGDGSEMLDPADKELGKVSLHRDGFHASAAARYLIALNAVQFLTDKSVYGNTYRPGEIKLDSAICADGKETTNMDGAVSGVMDLVFDPLSENVVAVMQTIVEGIR